jgi:hypothetical protein
MSKRKNNTENEKFVAVGTKLSEEAQRRLDAISEKKGISRYTLMQMVADVIIRYMDDRHNLTPEIERLMTIFEHLNGWENCFNLADYTTTPEIHEAIYFFTDPQKKGMRAVHVERPWLEGSQEWTQTYNLQEIFERMVCLLMPERYRRLRLLAIQNNCSSILELVDTLIDEHTNDADLRLLRMEFEDADRSEFGKKPVDAPYKRKHYKSVNDDKLTNLRQRTLFDEDANRFDIDDDFDINDDRFGHHK